MCYLLWPVRDRDWTYFFVYGVPYIPHLMYASHDSLIGIDDSAALDPLFPLIFLYMRVLCDLMIRQRLILFFPKILGEKLNHLALFIYIQIDFKYIYTVRVVSGHRIQPP